MRLCTVGTGTAAPSPARVQSATLVESGDVRLLVDCGSGAVYRMAQLGIDWATITHLALTHFHADHTNDVANLLYAWRYGMLPPRQAPIEIIGPVGDVYKRQSRIGAAPIQPPRQVGGAMSSPARCRRLAHSRLPPPVSPR